MVYHSGNQMIDPQILFQKAQLREGMHAADLGCGRTGHFVFPASAAVGESGIVYAVDIVKDVLENIEKRAAMSSLSNIHTVWADLEQVGQTPIPAGSIDVAFLINTLVQSKKRSSILDEAKRLLKDKARLLVVDWAHKGLSFGPPEEDFVDFGGVKKWAWENGLAVQEEFKVGPFHKGLVLYKHD